MTDKYAHLREALDAGPTPGPWKANTSNEIGPISKEDDQSFGMVLPVCFAEFENSEANRRYIAACHPETIRAMLADYDRMRDALEWYSSMSKEMGNAAIHQDSQAMLTLMKEIAVDYGKRARAALAQEGS